MSIVQIFGRENLPVIVPNVPCDPLIAFVFAVIVFFDNRPLGSDDFDAPVSTSTCEFTREDFPAFADWVDELRYDVEERHHAHCRSPLAGGGEWNSCLMSVRNRGRQ